MDRLEGATAPAQPLRRAAQAWLAGQAGRSEAARAQALAALAAGEPALHAAVLALQAAPAPADARIGARLGRWRILRTLADTDIATIYQAEAVAPAKAAAGQGTVAEGLGPAERAAPAGATVADPDADADAAPAASAAGDGQAERTGRAGQAEQAEQAAIKCLRAEWISPTWVGAFLLERSQLGRLRHPHIAGLVDGGMDADGLPWSAMRFIQGQPIDQWCDARTLPLRARMALLVQACEALAYAHAQGVLHRDLKPANLLVEADGQVQLVDFGIAALAGAGRPRVVTTPAYVAPELLERGVDSPASEVYALGAILYRLAADAEPRGPDSGAPRALPALAAEAAGSEAIARRRGQASARALQRELDGDLAAIALKAVQARPQARYASVEAFAADLRAWLQRQPVSARGRGLGYRGAHFLGRHRAAVGAGLGLAAALAGAAAWALLD